MQLSRSASLASTDFPWCSPPTSLAGSSGGKPALSLLYRLMLGAQSLQCHSARLHKMQHQHAGHEALQKRWLQSSASSNTAKCKLPRCSTVMLSCTAVQLNSSASIWCF